MRKLRPGRGRGWRAKWEETLTVRVMRRQSAPERGSASFSVAPWVPHSLQPWLCFRKNKSRKANKIPINKLFLYISKIFHNHQVIFQYFIYSSAACS